MRRSPFTRKPPPDGQKWGSTFKPKEGAPLKRAKPLRRRSRKTAALYAGSDGQEGRAALVARLLAKRAWCEACPRLVMAGVPTHCGGEAVDVHEILARSAGGSILDENNLMCVCRWAHSWIGDNPSKATALDLRRSRYNRPNGKDFT